MASYEESDNELAENDEMTNIEELFDDDEEEEGNEGDEGSLKGDDNGEDGEEVDKDKRKKRKKGEDGEEEEETKQTKKRVIKNPRVTLNLKRLMGPNGICALFKIFDDFKPQGEGHELEDMTRILFLMEHWACDHLLPGKDFAYIVRRLEKLGELKEVQAYLDTWRRKPKEPRLRPRPTGFD